MSPHRTIEKYTENEIDICQQIDKQISGHDEQTNEERERNVEKDYSELTETDEQVILGMQGFSWFSSSNGRSIKSSSHLPSALTGRGLRP